jgi:hypothetical protein
MLKFPKIKTCKSKDLLGTLDTVFSEFIRLRDSDENGYCRCITCGRVFYWKEIENGHFIQRDRKATRFHEENCHSQCTFCNKYRSGRQFEHGQKIDILYGKGTAQKLTELSKAYCKLDYSWLQWFIAHYRALVRKMKLEKTLRE